MQRPTDKCSQCLLPFTNGVEPIVRDAKTYHEPCYEKKKIIDVAALKRFNHEKALKIKKLTRVMYRPDYDSYYDRMRPGIQAAQPEASEDDIKMFLLRCWNDLPKQEKMKFKRRIQLQPKKPAPAKKRKLRPRKKV